jgi:hypothetical protein
MKRPYLLATLAACIPAAADHAYAHGFAGDHMFISTLLIDDPNVADEASLPTFSYLPQPADSDPAPALSTLSWNWSKRITETFGFGIGNGYSWLTQPGARAANGWSNLVVSLKWKPYVNDEHEFMMSVGVQRQFAGTGAAGTTGELLNTALGFANGGATIPAFTFGKGFGDLPVPLLRPLALTGELGYAFTDTKLKVDPVGFQPLNNGNSNYWVGGLSLQYSLRYLSSEVKDYGFSSFVNKLTPVVELEWSSPAGKPTQFVTEYLWGIGMNYTTTGYAIGVEMLVPGNRNTGSHLGVIAQFHLYFDDLLPHSLGAPIVAWF